MNHTTKPLPLLGLDGTNPLGFLAALGVLVALNEDSTEVPALSWVAAGGTWIAQLHMSTITTEDELIRELLERLNNRSDDHPARRWSTFADGDSTKIRQLLSDHRDAWCSCIGVEPLSCEDESKRMSQLQTARKDYQVTAITNLLAGVSEDSLRRTILKTWDYAEPLEGLTLHLDPSEDRRHAYQWNQPAGDPDRKTYGNMIAANRLALESLVMFATVPVDGLAQTVGFKGRSVRNTFWTWPLWTCPANRHEVQTLLTLNFLQLDQPEPRTLQAMGIEAVFRTQRILVGKTPNLTPPQRVA